MLHLAICHRLLLFTFAEIGKILEPIAHTERMKNIKDQKNKDQKKQWMKAVGTCIEESVLSFHWFYSVVF